MKPLLIFLFSLFALGNLSAQGDEQVVQKPDGYYTYHYFNGTKRVSTTQFRPSTGHKGYAVAHDRLGNEIYRQETSTMHMMRSVHFSYHPDGSLAKAVLSWHPDGGIQHGTTTTTFDEKGRRLDETKWSSEDEPGLLKDPGIRKTPSLQPSEEPVTPRVQITVEESPVYQNTYFLINRTKRSLVMHLLDNSGKPLPASDYLPQKFEPGDTIQGKTLLMAGIHANPCDYFQIRLEAKKAKWAQGVALNCKRMTIEELSSTTRNTYYELTSPNGK